MNRVLKFLKNDDSLKRKYMRGQGFNMLEIVIGVGLMLILSAGGVVVFNGLNEQTKLAKVTEAATSVYSAMILAESYSKDKSSAYAVIDNYNDGNEDIWIEATEVNDGVPRSINSRASSAVKTKYCVTAYWKQNASDIPNEDLIQATAGFCNENVVNPDPEEPEIPIIPRDPILSQITYQCDVSTTGVLGFKEIDNDSKITLQNENGDVQNVDYRWNQTNEVTLEAGVKYTAVIDGKFNIMNSGVIELEKCVKSIDKLDEEAGIVRLMTLGNGDFTVPNNIPRSVTSLASAFSNAYRFNDPNINSWDTSNVTDMAGAFANNWDFNQPLTNWNTSNVIRMSNMFSSANKFDQSLAHFNTSKVTEMNGMFYMSGFNQSLSNFDTSKVTDMYGMFMFAWKFDQDISGWNTSSLTSGDYFIKSTYPLEKLPAGVQRATS